MRFKAAIPSHLKVPMGPGGILVDVLIDPDDPKTNGEFDLVSRGTAPDGEVLYDIPGPHWQPLDEEAKALCKRHGIKFTGEVPDVVEDLAVKLEAAKEQRLQQQQLDQMSALGKEIGAAIAEKMLAAQQGGKKAA